MQDVLHRDENQGHLPHTKQHRGGVSGQQSWVRRNGDQGAPHTGGGATPAGDPQENQPQGP